MLQQTNRTAEDSLDLLTESSLSHAAVLRIAMAGIALVVGLVLLAGYLGYQGSHRIQDTAQELIRDHLLLSERGATIEGLIVTESQELIGRLTWVLGLCVVLAAGTAALTVWIIQRAFARLEWQSAELSRVSWHLLEGHENMARRFSHEMHDELGQSLSGLRRMLNRPNPQDFPLIQTDCVAIVDEVLQNVRKLSQALRPVILDDLGLDSGLRWLCERFEERTQIAVAYRSNWNGRLDDALETHLFRITQEALTNIARHAEASQAEVELTVRGGRVHLRILDNGHGIRESGRSHSPSLGMVGMRARARQIGGELIVQNRSEGGLSLFVNAPLQEASPYVEQENPSFAS